MNKVIGWLRANGAAIGVGGGILGVGFAYSWNGTESWRMSRNIRSGCYRPKEPSEFDEKFCLFDMRAVKVGLDSNGMVAFVGLKSTGKTTTLEHLLYKAENPFFIEISHDDVHGAIYRELKDKVWSLPWLADSLRVDSGKSSKKIVTEVFDMVRDLSGKPVFLGFDVNTKSTESIVQGWSMADNVQRHTSFNPTNFVKATLLFCV